MPENLAYRNNECLNYDKCLDLASRANVNFKCDPCEIKKLQNVVPIGKKKTRPKLKKDTNCEYFYECLETAENSGKDFGCNPCSRIRTSEPGELKSTGTKFKKKLVAMVSFKEHSSLYEALRKDAEDNFRSMGEQALFILFQYYKGKRHADSDTTGEKE